jgi:hypothetical protein
MVSDLLEIADVGVALGQAADAGDEFHLGVVLVNSLDLGRELAGRVVTVQELGGVLPEVDFL